MTKNDVINDVVYAMSGELSKEQLDRLKITMLVKMQDCEVTEMRMLPVVSQHDNDWILKRFMIDSLSAGKKESSIKQYASAVRKLFADTGKHYTQITGQDITDYLALKQYRDKISINYKATLNKYFAAFFNWAYRKHHISVDIMLDVDRAKPLQKRKERLTDEEIEDIRDACRTLKEKALVELMLDTGMRVGEIVALNLSDFDFTHKRVSIYGEKTSEYRTGMLTTRSIKALRKYVASREYCTGALFINDRAPHNRMQKAGIEKMCKDIAVRAGITRIPVTVHVFRKTFASVLYRKTKNILLVSKLLGHASTDTTVKYYLIDDIDDMQHQYNMVNG